MIGLLDRIMGVRRLRLPSKRFVELANIMMREDIRYASLKDEGTTISFIVTDRSFKRISEVAELAALDAVCTERIGIPHMLYRYRKRFGILIGALIIAVLTKLSTMYVWDVRVEGNVEISDSEVLAGLEELGFGVGSRISKTDYYGICHRLPLINDNISWVSVNMEGTYAVVRIIERDKNGAERDNGTPSNLVAAIDGEIVRTETVSGQTEVSVGQSVKQGELLISGVVKVGQGDSGRFVLLRSKGKVFARTNRVFKAEIPLEGEKSVVKERILRKKTLNFFGKALKLKEKYSISEENCVIIKNDKRVVLFEGIAKWLEIPLPISVSTEYVCISECEKVTYSEEEALAIAEAEIAEAVLSVLPEAEIVSRDSSYEVIDGVLVLIWRMECIENIAVESPIGVV